MFKIQDDGIYLIDYDDDEVIDFIFNSVNEELSSYEGKTNDQPSEEVTFPTVLIGIIVVILCIIIFIAYLFKSGHLYIESEEESEEEDLKK